MLFFIFIRYYLQSFTFLSPIRKIHLSKSSEVDFKVHIMELDIRYLHVSQQISNIVIICLIVFKLNKV